MNMDQEELDISDIIYIAVVTLIMVSFAVVICQGLYEMVSNALR